MDIYEYIKSKDIREHCRKLGHKFRPMEAAFLIFHSRRHTIAQKHSAWEELIGEYPDEAVAETFHCSHLDSFHGFLREYIALENKLLERFFAHEENCVYSFAATFRAEDEITEYLINSRTEYTQETGALFGSFEAGLEFENTYNLNIAERTKDPLMFYTVMKQSLILSKGQERKSIIVRVNKDGEPLAITDHHHCGISDSEWETLYRFEDMWIDVPTPFKKGDILFANRINEGYAPDPFVLVELCTDYISDKRKKHCDTTDMSAVGYRIIDEAGHICHDNTDDYLSFEYYAKPLKKPYLILNAINRFFNDKIDIYTAMEAYHYLLSKAEVEQGDTYVLGLAGILEDDDDSKNMQSENDRKNSE